MNSKQWSENKLPLELAEALMNELGVDVSEKSLEATNKAFYDFLTNYNLHHFSNEKNNLGVLCGNTGEVNTTDTAVSPEGIKTGGKHPCFCPNGRVSRDDKYETIKSPFVLYKDR